MKNKIEYFFEKSSYITVFLVSSVFFGIFIDVLIHLIGIQEELKPAIRLRLASLTGVVFGLMFVAIVNISRKNSIFWDYAKELEKKIQEAAFKEDLNDIFNNEFKELGNKAFGSHHYHERKRLYTLLTTRREFLPEK